MDHERNSATTSPRRWRRHLATTVVVAAIVYVLVAYIALPLGWLEYGRHHPTLEGVPTITHTGDDIPGDPLNVALVGSERELKTALLAAGWDPADPLTLKSCLEIAEATVLSRRYNDAPVSNLYLFNRKEDLAFEKPVGDNPRQRNHVRFWKTTQVAHDGRPVWVGSATFDERVGLSETTGQITHHVAPNIDAERDRLMNDLRAAGQIGEVFMKPGFQPVREGRNGGGDRWETDGDLAGAYLTSTAAKPAPATP